MMLELSVKIRPEAGRNKALRKQGLVPAVLYGHKVKNLNLMVDEVELSRIYKKAGENTLVKLKIAGEDKKMEERMVLIQDAVKDPVHGSFVHLDFHQVRMNEAITAEIPLVFVGQSEVVEREGGLLVKALQHIEVEALPQDLPHEIEVDISPLNTFDDKIVIKDLKIPAGVKVKTEEEDVVASVVPPRTQEELEAIEEKPEENLEEVKVEKEEEKEEEKQQEEEIKEE